MTVYASLETMIASCREWLDDDGPWSAREYHRRVSFASVSGLPGITDREKALAWGIGVGWIALPPDACRVCVAVIWQPIATHGTLFAQCSVGLLRVVLRGCLSHNCAELLLLTTYVLRCSL